MEKPENCAVIRYLFKKGVKGNKIHTNMVNILGNDAPHEQCGFPRTTINEAINDSVHDMENILMTTFKIAEVVGI